MKIQTKIKLKKLLSHLFNCFVITHKRRIFAVPLENSSQDCYDILNYTASNMFTYLNYISTHSHNKPIDIYLLYSDEHRLQEYNAFSDIAKKNNVNLKFIKSNNDLFSFVKINYLRFSSAVWMNESGGTTLYGRKKNQRVICHNYFISCKEDYQVGLERKWEYLDYLTTTSLLPSQIISSANGVLLGNCYDTGFPRNDNLFNKCKEEIIKTWISKEVGYLPKKIIVYAPTYRDYEKSQCTNRPLLGYGIDELNDYLIKNKIAIICKLHPYQNVNAIDKSCVSILQYKHSYDFSLYDLLAISDCLICDYSSLVFDYLLLDKPIIYNLYDLDIYENSRGLSYYPYSYFCAGEIVCNEKEFYNAINNVVLNIDNFANKRQTIRQIIHKHCDKYSTQRSINRINDYLSDNLGFSL